MDTDPLHSGPGFRTPSLTVKEAIDRFDFLTQPRPMIVATGLDEKELPELQLIELNLTLSSVLLNDDTVYFSLNKIAPLTSQSEPIQIQHSLNVATERIDGPSLFSLLRGENSEVEGLRRDAAQLKHLRSSYGNLKYELAQHRDVNPQPQI